MTKNIGTVNTSASFSVFYTLVNTVCQVLANEIVTANGAPGGGAMSIGNGYVTGFFGANNLCAGQLLGGNVTATTALALGSNLVANGTTVTFFLGNSTVNSTMNSTNFSVGANVDINLTNVSVGNSTVNSALSQASLTISGVQVINSSAVGFPTVFLTSSNVVVGSGFWNSTNLSVSNGIFTYVQTSTANVATSINVGPSVTLNTSTLVVGTPSVGTVTNTSGFYLNGTPIGAAPSAPTVNATTSGTSTQLVDTFVLASSRACEYMLQVTDTSGANNYMATKVILLQSGGSVFLTEYGTVVSNNLIGSFSASSNATTAILNFTPTPTATSVKGTKNLLPV